MVEVDFLFPLAGKEVPLIRVVAAGTIDEHIIDALVEKKDIARIITGDAIVEWL